MSNHADNPTLHKRALEAIAAERERQIDVGYDAAHDGKHSSGEIITATWGAVGRINAALDAGRGGDIKTYIKRLTQAAAQIAAEIERVSSEEDSNV